MQTEVFFFALFVKKFLQLQRNMEMTERTSIGYDVYDISTEDLIPERKYSDHNDQTWIY